MNKWKWIRSGLMTLMMVASLFMPLEPQVKPPMDWSTLAIIFVFIPFGLLFVIGIQAFNPLSVKVWKKPNWNLNPMNFRDPVQFFHFAAYLMLAQGFITILRLPFSNNVFHPGVLIPLVMGVGLLIGVQMITLIFKSKYSEKQNKSFDSNKKRPKI
ncbi:MAG: hypothetical protein GY845_04215 [Planctomycetes bacterium]|nr:hypothetical protein [Planctomycetota bacterium]